MSVKYICAKCGKELQVMVGVVKPEDTDAVTLDPCVYCVGEAYMGGVEKMAKEAKKIMDTFFSTHKDGSVSKVT